MMTIDQIVEGFEDVRDDLLAAIIHLKRDDCEAASTAMESASRRLRRIVTEFEEEAA